MICHDIIAVQQCARKVQVCAMKVQYRARFVQDFAMKMQCFAMVFGALFRGEMAEMLVSIALRGVVACAGLFSGVGG
jgi:hypothetical protein